MTTVKINEIKDLNFEVPRAVGQIKMGRKAQNHPEKLDHFLLTTLKRDGANFGNLVPWDEINDALRAKNGDKPRSLRVSFLYDTISANCITRYALWNPKLRAHTCVGNGFEANEGLQEKKQIQCTPDLCEAKGCKPSTILICTLLDFPQVGGPFVMFSKGWNSLRGIMYGLTWAKQQTGILAGLPFTLSMQPKTSEYEPGKSGTTWFASLLPELDLHSMLTKAADIKALRATLGIDVSTFEKKTVEVLRQQADAIEAESMESGEYEEPEDQFQQPQHAPESKEELEQQIKAAMKALGWNVPTATKYLEESKAKGMDAAKMLADLREKLKSA